MTSDSVWKKCGESYKLGSLILLSGEICYLIFLKNNHLHLFFFQVQCQMLCSRRNYCDFVAWMEDDIHVERIYPDVKFWSTNPIKAK